MTAAPSSALVGNTTALLPEPIIGSSDRLANTTASLPIVYGSMAFYLGKKADEMQTHEWTLFLRGPNDNSNNQDHYTLNSLVISKVVFQLHPSFAQPTRELTEPPYEVTERGWGEFEAQIQIHWKDPTEQPTIVNHTIKLYPPKPPGSSKEDKAPPQSTEKPVLAEMYDEVVFTNPSPSFFHSLTQLTGVDDRGEDEDEEDPLETAGSSSANKNESTTTRSSLSSSTSTPSSWRDHLHNVYSDQDDFLALIAAQKFLQSELSGVKQRFQNVNEEMALVDQKLLLAQQQLQRDAAAAAVRGSTATTSGDPSSGNKRKKGSRSSSSSQKKSRTTPTAAASKSSRKSPGVASSGVKANIKK